MLLFGITPLHLYLRLYEFLLDLAYRGPYNGIARLNEQQKSEIAARKKEIQQKMKDELGILVGVPLSGGVGNSNCGNSARKAFKNYSTFSAITGIPEELVRRLYHLICVMNQRYQINPDKFEENARLTEQVYLASYANRKMTVTMHRLIHHGADFIRALPLPPVFFGEHAQESRNKDVGVYR